jgi:hypothetical protein
VGKVFSDLDERNAAFIQAQRVFFVATAPLEEDGLLNLSPKGLDTFRILDPHTVAYLDLIGSGIETVAHLRENGRIVLMFCAFEGPPRILRLHGHGTVVLPEAEDFATLVENFPAYPGVRSVIKVTLARISDSCGFGIPRYTFETERSQLQAWATKLGPEALQTYQEEENRTSVGGLPGLP